MGGGGTSYSELVRRNSFQCVNVDGYFGASEQRASLLRPMQEMFAHMLFGGANADNEFDQLGDQALLNRVVCELEVMHIADTSDPNILQAQRGVQEGWQQAAQMLASTICSACAARS